MAKCLEIYGGEIMYLSEYSEKEKQLFHSFGYDDTMLSYIDPVNMYKMAAINAFVNRYTGSNVEALAKAMKAIGKCGPYRHTPEFEQLITFGDLS